MANTRISDLTASASNLASTDLAPVVQTAGVGPVKMTGLQLAGGLLGSATFNGATVSTSQPVLNLTQTWNDGAGGTVTFTGLKFNATDTASASGSLLLDLQVGGASKMSVAKTGTIAVNGPSFGQVGINLGVNTATYSYIAGAQSGGAGKGLYIYATSANIATSSYDYVLATTGFFIKPTLSIGWASTSDANQTVDLFLTRAAAATLQLGAADAAAPVAQTFKVQSVVAGTSNTAGANFTIQGSQGTGTGAGGSIIFQVAPAGSSGTAQNAYQTVLQITGAGGLTGQDGATANTLALRNGGTSGTPVPQTFNIYNYYASGTDYERGALKWSSGILTLAVEAAGTGSIDKGFQIIANGVTKMALAATSGIWTITGTTNFTASVSVASGSLFYWASRSVLASPADGQISLLDQAGSGFGRLNFGGITSSFPALKRSTTTLQVRLADDSAFGSFQTGGFSGGAPTIKTANYTQLEADYSLIFNGTGSITLTLLAAATYPGKILYVKTIAAQTVVSASSNVKPIDTDTAGTAILAATAGKWAMLQSDGTNWVIMAQG